MIWTYSPTQKKKLYDHIVSSHGDPFGYISTFVDNPVTILQNHHVVVYLKNYE